ncbi:hypothetical protein PG994_003047 [Apiospora phragmitis]|uniref:SET domain-containing protein n=1 Tax=Apiospora phragmitis TaxID=2905665 RepID=A0ABR1W6X0_9PEZI
MSGSNNPNIRLSDSCEARHLGPDRGYGVIATKDISSGRVILRDEAIIKVDAENLMSGAAQREINRRYNLLPAAQKQKYDALHCFIRDEEWAAVQEKAQRIMPDARIRADYLADYRRACTFATNSFGLATSRTQSAIFLDAARFNHACYDVQLPRKGGAEKAARWEAYAVRDIEEGEEITLNYYYRTELRAERQANLLYCWGFACTCDVCVPGPRSAQHDANLRNLNSDSSFWGKNHHVSRWFTKEDIASYVERLEERLGLSRAVGDQDLIWVT